MKDIIKMLDNKKNEARTNFREKINKRFLVFTDYTKKETLENFIALFLWYSEHPKSNPQRLQKDWKDYLTGKAIDPNYLDFHFSRKDVDTEQYLKKEKLEPGHKIYEQWKFYETLGVSMSKYRQRKESINQNNNLLTNTNNKMKKDLNERTEMIDINDLESECVSD